MENSKSKKKQMVKKIFLLENSGAVDDLYVDKYPAGQIWQLIGSQRPLPISFYLLSKISTGI